MTGRPLLVGLGWLDRPGGLERYLADLRTALDDPTTVVLADRAEAAPGLHVAAAPGDPLLRRLVGVRRAVAATAGGADVLDLHFALTGLGALASASARRLPKVIHFQGPWADEGPARGRRARRLVERLVHHGAQRSIVLSGSMGRVLVERYGADPWRIEIVPPGVDLDRFRPGDQAAARRGLGIEAPTFVVVAVRRLVERTGVAVLLDAWAAAAPALPPDAVLLVAGTGPQGPALEAQLAERAPVRPVRLLGQVDEDDLVALYQAADLAVVPSVRLEGFGLVALEALACGTPVLATRCGGLPDAVAGLGLPLVEPGSVGDLRDALVEAAAGRPTAEACRARAERFRWAGVAERHRTIYTEAADRVEPPGLRVVVVDHSAARSGGEVAMARLLEARPGARVHAILFETGPFESMLSAAGVTAEVRPLGAAARVDRRAAGRPLTLLRHGLAVTVHAARLAARLRRLRPDVVHANSLKAGLIVGVAARAVRVPMVWHVRDRLAGDYLPERSARLARWGLRHLPVAVIAPSQAVLDTLGPPGRRAVERVVVPDPFPVGPPRARPAADRRLEVVMVGRVARWKGQDVFLRAFAEAFPPGTAHATLIGASLFGGDDDAFAAEVPLLVGQLELDAHVTLLGERDDVDRWLARADVVVHASRAPEPFGQVVVEGMAAGAAVIATEGGGPSELIRDGVDGLLVPPDDVAALAAALRRLADDPHERARMGTAAQARIGALTDPRTVAAAVAGVHERAAARGPR